MQRRLAPIAIVVTALFGFFFGPALNRKKVDDLNEHARTAAASLLHGLDELLKPRNEPVVADAK